MTYQLSRLRLANVGDRAARFTDVTLDLSSAVSEPVDSILWLRNGGGKSSLLSLFFALLLPMRKDFMGRSVKRHLEDYVASGDTSHTVAEWVARSDDSLLPPARLITGAVYEWIERRKPVDPNRDRDKLKGWYYTFFAVPGELDLARLPLRDDAGHAKSMAEFVRSLREIAAGKPQQFSFAITDQRGQWMETLTARNLDPALFGYQKQMNHSEGGVSALFDFPSTEKFIDFLIDLTVDTAQPDLVANNLREVVDVLSRKPGLLVDREFCAEMAGRLDRLAERHERATLAVREAGEARSAAAWLAGAFRTAASAREEDKTWFAAEQTRLREEALVLDRERTRTNDIANELLRIAAAHRYTAAKEIHETAESVATETKDEDRAWEAVSHLADHVEAEHLAESVRRQITAEERESAPLRAARDAAAATLKARYRQLAIDQRESEAMEESTALAAEADADVEDGRERQSRTLATEASVRAENLRGRKTTIGEALSAAVRRGDLPTGESDPLVVLAQAQQTRREKVRLLDDVRLRRSARPAMRADLVEQSRKLATDRAGKTAERDRLAHDHKKLLARVDTLATDARLAELTQLADGGRLDLWSEAADLRAALTKEASTAESVIVGTRVDAAEDNRALDGLRADEFLPTTRDAQRAAEVLITAGVPAVPGWQALRDLVTEGDRACALENPRVAELAAGVVVPAAEIENARAVVASTAWHAVAHVTVCTVTQLEQAVGSAPAAHLVFPSNPALYDRAAAERARTDREERKRDLDDRIAVLQEQAKADRALLATLESFLQDCPPGHLDALASAISALDDAVAQIKEADRVLREQIDELNTQETADAEAEKELATELTQLARRIERLTALAEQASELSQLDQAIDQLDRDVQSCTRMADAAAIRAKDLRQAERAARQRSVEHKANWQRYEQEYREISLLDSERDAVGADVDEPLSLLRSRFRDLDSEWSAVATQSVLAERLKGLTERSSRAEQALNNYSESVRARALVLLGTGDGQDPERRAAARGRSRESADGAQRALSTAARELDQADEEVKRRTPRDRLRHAHLDVEPTTEDEARERAAVEAARATELSSQVTARNRDADEAGKASAEANTEAQVFSQRSSRLADAAAPTDVPADIVAYDGANADSDLESVLTRLGAAKAQAATSGSQVEQALEAVRRLASETRFSTIPDAIRDRFIGDDPDVLSAQAATRAGDMRLRAKTIDGQLEDIGRDQHLVVVEVAALVRDVLANLESAHRHSRLPGTLGRWANEHFLRIRFVRPASDEDLHARIDAVVDRIVAEKSKPEGLALLKRCVHEAVAPRGFTVKVLKPNSDLAIEPVDVTHLGKFSGGEKLTVCVALYCTLARLRAVNRGQGKAALGGTLVLDNPLGTASHVALLRLQRDVAAAHGVQLVYTTGVEDLGAVGQFPNVLRMRNAPGSLHNRRYVVLEERLTSEDGITSARVVRDGAS